MRMSVLDRILVALSTLIGMALAVCVAVRAFGVDLIGRAIDGLVSASEYGKYIVAGVAAVLVLLGILVLVFMFRRSAKRVDRSFVVIDSSDKGRVRIAMSAIEEMVRQAVQSMQGASNLKTLPSTLTTCLPSAMMVPRPVGVSTPPRPAP